MYHQSSLSNDPPHRHRLPSIRINYATRPHGHFLKDQHIRKMFEDLGETSAGFSADLPDALIGKLEGLKPPRVALVSLHLGAFSFPESETMFPVSNPIATPNARTMSSREIADIAEARHNDLVATIDRLFDKGLLRSSRKTRHENTGGRPVAVGCKSCTPSLTAWGERKRFAIRYPLQTAGGFAFCVIRSITAG